MAVALRTSGSTQGGASSTLVEFTTPSSVVAGDVWVCSATFRGGSGVTISAVPAAFTLQIRKDHTTGTTNVTTVVYTYVCLGTETASQANWQSITISSSAKSVTVVTPFSGVNTTTPITGTVVVGTGTTSATTTSLAAISANNAVYVVAGLQGGTSIPGLPSGSVHGALTTCGSIATSGGNSATNVGINTAYALGTESSQTYTSSGSSSTYAIIAVQLNVAVSYPADFGTLYTSN